MKMLFPATRKLQLAFSGFLVASSVASEAATHSVQRATQQTFYDCQFTEPLYLEGWGEDWAEVYMEHYANIDLETITFRLTYNDYAWLAIGINLEGGHHMTNSYAIIGSIDDGVQFYWMTSEEEDASGVWKLDDVHGQITEKSFVQEGGFTIMQFTMNMAIADEDAEATIWHYVNEDSAFIWGAGLSDNQWAGVHQTLGFFSGLQPHNGCQLRVVPTEAPTRAPTPAPVEEQVVEEADGSQDGASDGDADGASDIDGDGDNDGDGDEGTDTTNQGSGSSGGNIPGPGSSNLSPPPENPGPSSSNGSGSFSLVQGTTRASDETRSLWVTHGIFLGLAWGCFVPMAVGASYLKKNIAMLQKNATWLRVHFYLTVLAVLFTLIGFIIAVVAANKEDEPTHFSKTAHHKAGLAIFLLVMIQSAAGYFRPSPPKAAPRDTDDSDDDAPSSGSTNSSLNDTMESPTESNGMEMVLVHEVKNNSNNDKATKKTTKPKKSLVRQWWEYMHRALGMALLALGWYNCTSGIQLQASKYTQDDEERLLTLFWSISGCIAGCIFLIGYVIRPETS